MATLNLSEIALDIQFNAAVMTMANKVCPSGYLVGAGCPQSYEELIARLDAGKMMFVFDGGCDHTIYGCPEVNYAFRAWHDWCHWRGRHPFTFEGESAVCRMQGEHLIKLYGDDKRTRWWKCILHAEIIGQLEYCQQNGHFPDDQFAFVKAYLRKPLLQAAE